MICSSLNTRVNEYGGLDSFSTFVLVLVMGLGMGLKPLQEKNNKNQ